MNTMNLNSLLESKKINPLDVIVLRHRPFESKLKRVLPWLAAERPEVFNAYQQTQSEKLEKAMLGVKYIASFIGHAPGKALFVGLYWIRESRRLTRDEYWKIPECIELKNFDYEGYTEKEALVRPYNYWFDLVITDFYSEWKGKLVIGWPPPERSWWRRAHRNILPVISVLEDNALVQVMPPWEEINLSWSDISILPSYWKAILSQWRGVYLIFDSHDGKSYVGSAYGASNILGRWVNYSNTGHGGNSLLRERDPRNFQFTILQRVSPDMPPDEVIKLEGTWKERLHTRQPFGLNEN
ncbi:MAG: GIY-YIG nuclease family protein [Phyllobacteriaceae bacterium]|nr:GIY-YIG nuclease family protein [Phyllobacteriaceae bacterium]